MIVIKCSICLKTKDKSNFWFHETRNVQLLAYCNECAESDYLVEENMTACSVCKVKKDHSHFTYYQTRLKANGNRLRVNTNCKECSRKERKILNKIKRDNPPPPYLTSCPQCNKIVYEKSEDIPDGVDGTNGPWQCDHNHKSSKFRGYLCKRCNTGTGLIGDNVEYFKNAQNWRNKNAK